MAVQPTYPGVYVQEVPSGVRTIAGVSTSIAVFIGRAARGRMNQPVRCLSYTDFEREFSADTTFSDLPRYVKLFFINGGTDCYVVRVANGAAAASVHLQNEAGDDVLTLTAKHQGEIGNNIGMNVTYGGLQPEHTFNIELFRWEVNGTGLRLKTGIENLQNLSMNPNSSRYAPLFISQNSALVNASVAATAPAPTSGFSRAGIPIPYADAAALRDAWQGLIGSSSFRINVNGRGWVTVGSIDVTTMDVTSLGTFEADLITALTTAIENAYTAIGIAGVSATVSFDAGPTIGTDSSHLLRITSTEATGDILITTAATNDAAQTLGLGTAQGGLEVGAYAALRPAPNGLTLRTNNPAVWDAIAALDVFTLSFEAIDSTGTPVTIPLAIPIQATDTVNEKLGRIRDTVNNHRAANPRSFYWQASLVGTRLSIMPTQGIDDFISTVTDDATTTLVDTTNFTNNVFYSSLGTTGATGSTGTTNFQTAGAAGNDGTAPLASDYDSAYTIIESQVDLFNLMVLPPDNDPPPGFSHQDLWSAASVFCQQQRAFLLIDAPTDWGTAQEATDNVNTLRIGVVTDHCAVFYPRLRIREDLLDVHVGATGAIAGLMARTDGTRGVWKAPAGTEADIRGIRGLEYNFSDRENGILNPRAINTLRIFPNGIVSWGARTLDGDNDFGSEWKYIPVRRTALFIEESLYRGLQWAVFEPNDEPLWAQIRLNVGAFMHNLFRQGAFQGSTRRDAYFVKCDSETTTQNDIDLGIVNVWVGFAPLKPAEFVILYLQQMTGQIQV